MQLTEQEVLQFLMKWRAKLSAAAWLVVRDVHAAEDIFQNVALKAMTRNVTFETEAALMSWALITSRREGIDWIRRQGRESAGIDSDILDLLQQEWQSEPSQPAGARMDALQSCLESMPESSRMLLKLRYFDGYSCEEVAGQLGVGLDALYKRVSRLHEALKRCIEGRLAGSLGSRGGGS